MRKENSYDSIMGMNLERMDLICIQSDKLIRSNPKGLGP